jgi:hypothetical protein
MLPSTVPAWLARWVCVCAALVLAWTLVAAPGRAQEAVNSAGLIVIDGEGGVGYAVVTFEEPEISGMELLRRAGATRHRQLRRARRGGVRDRRTGVRWTCAGSGCARRARRTARTGRRSRSPAGRRGSRSNSGRAQTGSGKATSGCGHGPRRRRRSPPWPWTTYPQESVTPEPDLLGGRRWRRRRRRRVSDLAGGRARRGGGRGGGGRGAPYPLHTG